MVSNGIRQGQWPPDGVSSLPLLLRYFYIYNFSFVFQRSTEKFTINIDFFTPSPLPHLLAQVFILLDSPEAKPKSGALAPPPPPLLLLLPPLGCFFSHATARNRNKLRSRRGRQSTTTRRVWERREGVESQRQWLRQRLRLRQRQRQSHP